MATSINKVATKGRYDDAAWLVVSIVLLCFTWLMLFGWLALLTELLLTPWDVIPSDFRPPVGNWSRTVNDFFEGPRGDRLLGQIVVGLSALAFAFRAMRAKNRPAVALAFAGTNLLFLVASLILGLTLIFLSPWLFQGTGYGTPVGVGFHGKALPLGALATLATMLLLGQWAVEMRRGPSGKLALRWIWTNRASNGFTRRSYMLLAFAALLATATITFALLCLSVPRWPPLPVHSTPREALLEQCLNAVRADMTSAETLQQKTTEAGLVTLQRWKPLSYSETGPKNYYSASLVVPTRFGWRVECRASTTLGRVESGFAAGKMKGDSIAPVSYAFGVSNHGDRVRVEWADGQADIEGLQPNGSFLVVRDGVFQPLKVDLLDVDGDLLESKLWPLLPTQHLDPTPTAVTISGGNSTPTIIGTTEKARTS
ncbi:MAG: hypothetical protein ACOX87_06565, partial [Chloroflexota bacterium]